MEDDTESVQIVEHDFIKIQDLLGQKNKVTTMIKRQNRLIKM